MVISFPRHCACTAEAIARRPTRNVCGVRARIENKSRIRSKNNSPPSYVGDVGEAIARCFDTPEPGTTYELSGPNTYTYKELLQTMCHYLGIRRVLAPMPINVWKILAFAAEFLPASPVTLSQIELMTKDNVASAGYPGFRTLGTEPKGIEIVQAPARRV